MLDLNGDTVHSGTRKTFDKNLTYENLNNVQSFQVYNSIQGRRMDEWLNEIKIRLSMNYTDVDTGGGGCRSQARPAHQPPLNNNWRRYIQSFLGIPAEVFQEVVGDYLPNQPIPLVFRF